MGKLDRLKTLGRRPKLPSPYDTPVLIRTPSGLFHVQVVNLANEPSLVDLVPAEIGLVLGLVRLLFSKLSDDDNGMSENDWEARVVALDYPRERRIAGQRCTTKREAEAKCGEFVERLRTGWIPVDEAVVGR